MAQKNAINNKTGDLTVDPGASGDSFVQFDINATGEFRVGVDDTDDSFRISQGSALGTSDTFIMTASGEQTMPLQPAFLGIQASNADNVTGNGTFYLLGVTTAFTEVFDQGGDFTTAGVFTAPITGRYYLSCAISYDAVAGVGGAQNYIVSFVTSNETYRAMTLPTENDVTSFAGTGGFLPAPSSVFCDMDASDTATVQIGGFGGTAQTDDIKGDATIAYTYFGGYLTC